MSKARKGGGSHTAGPDHRALGRLEAALIEALGDRGVTEVQYVVASEAPYSLWIWLTTATDAERDALTADDGLDAAARAVARRAGLAEFCEGIRVESQETVDRDFAGNWLHRLR